VKGKGKSGPFKTITTPVRRREKRERGRSLKHQPSGRQKRENGNSQLGLHFDFEGGGKKKKQLG